MRVTLLFIGEWADSLDGRLHRCNMGRILHPVCGDGLEYVPHYKRKKSPCHGTVIVSPPSIEMVFQKYILVNIDFGLNGELCL